MEMEIVDSQMGEYEPVGGWPAGMDETAKATCAVELALAAMDAAGVDGAVISSSSLTGFADAAIMMRPQKFAATLAVSPDTPDVVNIVSGLRSRSHDRFSPGWLGIRLVFSWPPNGVALERLRSGAYEPIFEAAEKNHIPTNIFLSGDLQEALLIAKAHPDLIMIIDHFGMPAPPMMHYDNPPFRQLELLLQLAQFPNVSVKFSGAPALSRETYPFADLWPSLHRVVDTFGPERLLWGADFPRCKGLHTYAEGVNYLLYTTELSDRDKELIFGVTLRRIMRWPRRQ